MNTIMDLFSVGEAKPGDNLDGSTAKVDDDVWYESMRKRMVNNYINA